jgi:hypothetical protein
MSTGADGPAPGVWQRRALRAVLPVGFTMLSLWTLWFLMALLDGALTPLAVVQVVLGLVASAALVIAGSAYRQVIGEQ